jgi:DNA polymerase
MRWSERQRAMLAEMGLRLWLPETAPVDADAAEAGGAPVVVDAAAVAGASVARQSTSRNRAAADGAAVVRADWLVVGEAADDERADAPFAGRAGQLLDNMLLAIGLSRGDAAPARRAHALPAFEGTPGGDDSAAALAFERWEAILATELERVGARVVLALGRGIAQALLRSTEPFGKLRGRVHRYRGLPLVVTFAPAYLLRHPEDKAGAWDDLCLAVQSLKDSGPA